MTRASTGLFLELIGPSQHGFQIFIRGIALVGKGRQQ